MDVMKILTEYPTEIKETNCNIFLINVLLKKFSKNLRKQISIFHFSVLKIILKHPTLQISFEYGEFYSNFFGYPIVNQDFCVVLGMPLE